jgi:type IV pilus assembly protein PilB
MNNVQVAELLREREVLNPAQIEDVLQEASINGKSIAQTLIDNGFVDQQGFYQLIAESLGTEFFDLNGHEVGPEILRLIPGGLARLIALSHSPQTRTRSRSPSSTRSIRARRRIFRFALGKDVHVIVSPTDQVEDGSSVTTAARPPAWRIFSSSSAKPAKSCSLYAATKKRRMLRPKQTRRRSSASSI